MMKSKKKNNNHNNNTLEWQTIASKRVKTLNSNDDDVPISFYNSHRSRLIVHVLDGSGDRQSSQRFG